MTTTFDAAIEAAACRGYMQRLTRRLRELVERHELTPEIKRDMAKLIADSDRINSELVAHAMERGCVSAEDVHAGDVIRIGAFECSVSSITRDSPIRGRVRITSIEHVPIILRDDELVERVR